MTTRIKAIDFIDNAFFAICPCICAATDGFDVVAMQEVSDNDARKAFTRAYRGIETALELLEDAGQQIGVRYDDNAEPIYYGSKWTEQTIAENVFDVFAATRWDLLELLSYGDWTSSDLRELEEDEQDAQAQKLLQDAIDCLQQAKNLFDACSKAIN